MALAAALVLRSERIAATGGIVVRSERTASLRHILDSRTGIPAAVGAHILVTSIVDLDRPELLLICGDNRESIEKQSVVGTGSDTALGGVVAPDYLVGDFAICLVGLVRAEV